jgi:hypothetical protein
MARLPARTNPSRETIMKIAASFAVGAVLSIWLLAPLRSPGAAAAGSGPALGHMVFFDLKEKTKGAREKLVAACNQHLSGHEGTLHFSAGTIAEDLRREVNDLDFDVALHLVFESKEAHDRYQDHPRHKKFIEESKDAWKRVRVFDSYLSQAPGERKQGEGGEPKPKEKARG